MKSQCGGGVRGVDSSCYTDPSWEGMHLLLLSSSEISAAGEDICVGNGISD